MDQRERLIAMLRGSPRVMTVLETIEALGLPDALLVSGAIYQTAWNALSGRAPDHGIKDYDVGYFDPDTSWDAEDAVIHRVAGALPPSLSRRVEVRNQARVHLWFETRFGEPYVPLASTAEALSRFVCPAFAVGVRLEPGGGMAVVAPFGLDDVFAMRLCRNPLRPEPRGFDRITASARERWPEASIGP